MPQKVINLANSTNNNSILQPLFSTNHHTQYNQPIYFNLKSNSSQVPRNYVQLPKSNLIASHRQSTIQNSYPVPLRVQSQHLPPSYLVRTEPIIRRHPQNYLNLNFDYEQANFLCQSKITEQQIFCVVCNAKYTVKQKEKHIQKHIRKPKSWMNEEAIKKIKEYKLKEQKVASYKIKPIVQPQESYSHYQPNTYQIVKKVIYQDRNPQLKQRAIGDQQSQLQIQKGQQFKIQQGSQPFFLNYANKIPQHDYKIQNLVISNQANTYKNQLQDQINSNPQIIQIQPSQAQVNTKFFSYNNLQTRSLNNKNQQFQYPNQQQSNIQMKNNQQVVRNIYQINSNQQVVIPKNVQAVNIQGLEDSYTKPQINGNLNQLQKRSLVASGNGIPSYRNQERIFVQPENYSELSNKKLNQNYSLKRSFAPHSINNQQINTQVNQELDNQINQVNPHLQKPQTSFNQKQINSLKQYQPLQPIHQPQSDAESFSLAHQIRSSKNQLSKKGSSNYMSQFFGDQGLQNQGITQRKKLPFRSQW